jgi:hypothetical protein
MHPVCNNYIDSLFSNMVDDIHGMKRGESM